MLLMLFAPPLLAGAALFYLLRHVFLVRRKDKSDSARDGRRVCHGTGSGGKGKNPK